MERFIEGRNDGVRRRVEHIPQSHKQRRTVIDGDWCRVLCHDENGTRALTVRRDRIKLVKS